MQYIAYENTQDTNTINNIIHKIVVLLTQPLLLNRKTYELYSYLYDPYFVDALTYYTYLTFRDILLTDVDFEYIRQILSDDDNKEQIINLFEQLDESNLATMQELDAFYISHSEIFEKYVPLFVSDVFDMFKPGGESVKAEVAISRDRVDTTDILLESDIKLTPYRFVLHKHVAKRAGVHYDLRIEIKKDFVVSIAFRYNPFTQNRSLGIPQPIHESYWIDFEGEIKDGYGAGIVEIVSKGHAYIYKTKRGTLIIDISSKKYGRTRFAVIPDEDGKLLFVKTNKDFDTEEITTPTKKDLSTFIKE